MSYKRKRITVKIGSNVLARPDGTLDITRMSALTDQIAKLHKAGVEIIVISSGAVASGRSELKIHRKLDAVSARQLFSAVGQAKLINRYYELFREHNIACGQVLTTKENFSTRRQYLTQKQCMEVMLENKVIPIVNENDTVSVSELKFGDNDCLASLLVNLIGADLYINLTSAPGVYAANPQEVPDAGILECVEDVAGLDLGRMCGGKTSVGTGGMYSKLQAARRAAQLGVPTLILPGREADVLARAFAGEAVGTWVRPEEHAIPRRKFWLAYQSDPAGTVLVDAGAAEALLSKGSSLLPGGVRQVLGNFQKGALVRVARLGESDGHASLGVGLSNYSAADLRKIMGLRRHEVAAILGDAHYPEVIHRDNLLMDAAI